MSGVTRLLTLLILVAGCAERPAGDRPNVLLIVVDTLRADHLGAYGYPLGTSPNFDRFAAANLKYKYAISAAPWTSPSMASLFTAHYPTAHGVTEYVVGGRMPDDAISEDFMTLAEVLREADYATRGVTANAWVSDQRGYAQGFERFETIDYSVATVVNRLAFQNLDELRESEPFFLYLHYMDPHPPFQPPRQYVRRFREEQRRLPPGWLPPTRKTRDMMAAYDGEIFFFDIALGELFRELKRLGLYEHMVIAFVADHGFPFLEHGVNWHGLKLYNEDTHIPMVLKAPGLEGEVDTTVSNVDLFPTLLDVLGIDPPQGVQGVSLLQELELRRRRGVFAEITARDRNHRSFTTSEGLKLILAFDKLAHETVDLSDEKGVVGVFDSRNDFRERDPIQDEALVERLRGRLWEIYTHSLEINETVTASPVELDLDTVEELRRLGYLE